MKKIFSILVLIVLMFDVPCAFSAGSCSDAAYFATASLSPKELAMGIGTQDGDTSFYSSRDVYESACVEYKMKIVLLQESFDGDSLPQGWSVVDNDGDGYTWDTHTPRCIYTKHSGSGCISSASFMNNVGALTPDNWLITPALVIPENGNTFISWWITAQDLRYAAEHYEVYISNQSSAIADFDTVALVDDTLTTARNYRQRSLDLSAYAGQIVYIAFVHNKCNDQYWLNLDDIMVEFTPFDSVRTESGVYTYYEVDNHGDLDTVNLHYTVFPSYNQTEYVAICQSELPYTWRDTLFGMETVSSDHVFYKQTLEGCDSVVTLHLTVNYSSASDTSVVACGSYVWFDSTLTQSGEYTHTLTNAKGCDSVITLTLTVNPVYEQTENLTICQNDLPFEWRDTLFELGTVSGAYLFRRQTTEGCDSIVNLYLTVNPMFVQSENLTICQHELSYTWRDTVFLEGTVSGDYVFHRQSQLGCDSVVTLHLTVNSDTEGDTTAISCDRFDWYGNTYTESGEYTHTLTNAVGCDSVLTLHLTINHSTASVDVQEACDSLRWIDGVLYTESTNVPTMTITNAVGCDSVITLHLTINHTTMSVDVQEACDSLRWIDGVLYTESTNVPTMTLTNAAGCDSVITLQLTINHSVMSVDVQEACDSLRWIDGVLYTESTDVPTMTLTSATGCDSVVNLHLTINSSSYLEVSLTITDDDLPYVYGDTIFEPGTVQSGNYPFYFTTDAGCDSIIVLHLTVETGINDHGMAASMKVYPNPTADKVNVQLKRFNGSLGSVEIQVYDMYGKKLDAWQMAGETTVIDLSSYAAGVYFIKAVYEQSMIAIRKVLKQ